MAAATSSSSSSLRKRNNKDTAKKTKTTHPQNQSAVNKRIRKLSRFLGVNQSTLYATLVLLVAIVTAVVWNAIDTVDPAVRAFLRQICREEVYCNDALRPTRRTQKTTRDVASGQRLVEIPRRFLIWDLDALRNDFIQQELFSARIFGEQPLEADVFLSVYVALLQQNMTDLSPVLQTYLSILPTFDDFAEFHPLLLPSNNLTNLLGEQSYSYQLIRYKRKLIQLEYEALTNASMAFASHCSWKDFAAARLAVLTRSFGTGRLHENERDTQDRFDSLQTELEFYNRKASVNLTSGSFAMVPILDLYNHHAQPTVGYSYDVVRRAFVIHSLGLTAGHELWDSYGKHSDPHLYSKFGFVNGDGSESTQASLAAFHSLLALPDEINNDHELLRYLSFDDGYYNCIKPDTDDPAWEWKRLKFLHLRAIAHDARFWTVVVGPRNVHAKPTASSAMSERWPPRDSQHLHMDAKAEPDIKGVVGLCRLLTARHDDFDGRAMQLLRNHLGQAGSYILPQVSQHDALEYRTLRCLERLASQSLARFGKALPEAQARVAAASANLAPELRGEWTAAHLELGELQTLDLIRGMAYATQRHEWPSEAGRTGEGFAIRQKPCPPGLLQPLLDVE